MVNPCYEQINFGRNILLINETLLHNRYSVKLNLISPLPLLSSLAPTPIDDGDITYADDVNA